ncbi:hypothetical protein FRB97_002751 [Tulasnella sp. 331]|nr:hypothetical protein FRB97_002751 [Tulasnella sp. 331]
MATLLVYLMLALVSMIVAAQKQDVTVHMNSSRISYTVSGSPVTFQTFISPGNPGYWWPGDTSCASNLGVSTTSSTASLTFTGNSVTINQLFVYQKGGSYHVYLDGNFVYEASNLSPSQVDAYNLNWTLDQGGSAFYDDGCNPAPPTVLEGLKYGEHTVVLEFWDTEAIPVILSLVYDATKPRLKASIIAAIVVCVVVVGVVGVVVFIILRRKRRARLASRVPQSPLVDLDSPGYYNKSLPGSGRPQSYSEVNESHPSSIHLATLTPSTQDSYNLPNFPSRRPSSRGSVTSSSFKTAGSNPPSETSGSSTRDLQYPPPSRSRLPSSSSHAHVPLTPYSIPYTLPRRPSSPTSPTSLQTSSTSNFSELTSRPQNDGYSPISSPRPRFASASSQVQSPTNLFSAASPASPFGSEASSSGHGRSKGSNNIAILTQLLERGVPNNDITATIRMMEADLSARGEPSNPPSSSVTVPSPPPSSTSHSRTAKRLRQTQPQLPTEEPTTDCLPRTPTPPSPREADSTLPPLSSSPPDEKRPPSPSPTYHTTWRPATSPTLTTYPNPPPRYSFAGNRL